MQSTYIFFGSTTDSLIVLQALAATPGLTCQAVVTQPPKPIGRHKIITPTPIETWAKAHAIPVLSFLANPEVPNLLSDEESATNALETFKTNLFISASYGQKIPTAAIESTTHGGLNVHPSLLPRWRGADPVPWAILSGDHQTGVTVVTLSEAFDQGKIIAQKKVPITDHDTADPLRAHLFELGAQLLVDVLPEYLSGKAKGTVQDKTGTPYARRFTRDDGFESWEALLNAGTHTQEAIRIDRKFRGLIPWPGVWTIINLPISKPANLQINEKRLKILELKLRSGLLEIERVQLEGKNPVSFKQFLTSYFPPG